MAKTKQEQSEVIEKLEVMHDKLDEMSDHFSEANEKIEKVCSTLTAKNPKLVKNELRRKPASLGKLEDDAE